MKRNKLFKTLFVSVLSLIALAGCDASIADSLLPDHNTIIRDGTNIESITFENVPEQIPVGYFDTFNIYLKIVYEDGYVEEYPLTMASFPDDIRHSFNTVGSHKVTIAFRGNEVGYDFNVVSGKPYYLIRYYNYRGNIIDEEKVLPGNKPTIEAPTDSQYTNRPNDTLFKYEFIKWDKEVDRDHEAYQDLDIYPTYHKIQKRYDVSRNVIPTGQGHNFRVLFANYSGEYYQQYGAYIYLGRIERIPLIYSETESTTTPSISGELYFDLEHGSTKADHASNIVHEIYSKGMAVNTSDYNEHFKAGSGASPVAPDFYFEKGFDVSSATHDNAYALFEGDTSFTELYQNNIYEFVEAHDKDNKISYNNNCSSDLTPGNPYYRASIETNVDVVLSVMFDTLSDKYKILEYNYYFLFNKNSAFPVVEYAENDQFNSTGNKLSFTMGELENVLTDVVEKRV